MDINALYFPADEQPLDRMVPDGGFCGIFRTIACVGDSLSSGEFELVHPDGSRSYHDLFDYSWGQYLARIIGSKVYNFSRGGMSAKVYMQSFAEEKGFWNPELASQAYIFALGVNDVSQMLRGEIEMGSLPDIAADWHNNKMTFIGQYAAIMQRYKAIQPEAKFFLMTMPRNPDLAEDRAALYDLHAERIRELAQHFSNTYVLDLRRYGPDYDENLRSKFFLNGHMNACGYIFTAQMVASYLDFIIRHHMDDFRYTGLIGTGLMQDGVR